MAKLGPVNVVGVDVSVQLMQNYLYKYLRRAWNIDESDDVSYNCYSRAYSNPKKDGMLPEAFIGGSGGKEYQEILLNDTIRVTSFFQVSDNITFSPGGYATANVGIVFFANVPELKAAEMAADSLTHRLDEEVRLDVVNLLKDDNFGFTLQSVVTGLDKSLPEYGSTTVRDGLKTDDMQPYHIFRVNLELKYITTQCLTDLAYAIGLGEN